MLLVTGITGLTGRFLFDIIKKNDGLKSVRFLIRKTSDISWVSHQKPDFFCGDVISVDELVKCMEGVESVIHLVNIRYSPQVIEACIEKGVKRVIFVNTTGMYSKYQEYSNLYKQLENKILNSQLDYTIIRPTMIYGNHLDKNIHKLIKLLAKLPVFPVVGDGSSLMQPVYAGDLARVIYLAYKNKVAIGKDYNVAGKKPLSYKILLKEIAGALNKRVYFINIPYSLANLFPNSLVNLEKIQRLSEDKVFDYSKARDELGFNPISFQQGIRLEVMELKRAGILS